MTRRRLIAVLAPALAAVLVAVLALTLRSSAPRAQGAAGVAATTVQRGHTTVAITDYAFSPDNLTVAAGTRITFTNHDDTAHTATADGGSFGTGTIEPGKSRTVTLRRPGRYPYHCIFHAFMTGSVTVVSR